MTTLRMLSIDQVEKANSGHPGLPLGMAPTLYVLFSRFLRHDPSCPQWADRDRFILSAGHGSALLYSALHLFGYGLPLEELKRFRQLESLTPGHPEHGHTVGVEVTTGPLGQGIANSVGFALAERMLAARINPLTKHVDLVNHHTFVIASDGDLMEGISHEAASLAGHLGLGRLILFFDDNSVTIDGPAPNSCTDDPQQRFEAYGWHTQYVPDGNDLEAISSAIANAMAEEDRPSFIRVRTVIGYGAPNKAGKSVAHGSPLGAEEMRGTKEFYGWPQEPTFLVPEEVRAHFSALGSVLSQTRLEWDKALKVELETSPELSRVWTLHKDNVLEVDPSNLDIFEVGKSLATRASSQKVLGVVSKLCENLVGGSADLAESTGTKFDSTPITRGAFGGNEIHYGIREHAMAACSNGLILHGGFRPFCSTFLVFADYLRPSVRLAAIMGLPVIYLFSHDSVAVGEDGPTHEPVEQVAALRVIPNLSVLRPADSNEAAEAWLTAMNRRSGPTALILTRQGLPTLERSEPGWMARYGARIIRSDDTPQVTLYASGSEVSLALQSADALMSDHGIGSMVVSVPWRERLEALSDNEQLEFGVGARPAVVIEAGTKVGWEGIAGRRGGIVSIERFGASGPGATVLEELGMSVSHVCETVLEVLRP